MNIDLKSFTPACAAMPDVAIPAVLTPTLPEAIDVLERRMIEEALRKSAGNKQKAVHVLGLSRQGLIKKLKRLGL